MKYWKKIKIFASATIYDEIDKNGNLFLKAVPTGKKLYKHKFSEIEYGGNIDDDKLSIYKKNKNKSNLTYKLYRRII